MAIRFYIVPKIGTGTGSDPFRPKYVFDALGNLNISSGIWQGMDLGLEPFFIVAADVTPAEHSSVSAQADIISAPLDLTNTIGANLAAVQAALETMNIPSDWVTSGMTYQVVLRWVTRLCLFLQRLHGSANVRFFTSGLTLDSHVSDISAGARQKISDAIVSMGGSTVNVTLGMTLRQALKILADQLYGAPQMLGVPL